MLFGLNNWNKNLWSHQQVLGFQLMDFYYDYTSRTENLKLLS